jgi:hypothetical protein|tara:strand:- start:102 stop:272 length:171 start_codon:yes stop_codon:yes gene_type:complete
MIDDWPEGYKKYAKEVFKKLEATRKSMLESGWKHVCLEPNLMSLEEWKENQKQEDE